MASADHSDLYWSCPAYGSQIAGSLFFVRRFYSPLSSSSLLRVAANPPELAESLYTHRFINCAARPAERSPTIQYSMCRNAQRHVLGVNIVKPGYSSAHPTGSQALEHSASWRRRQRLVFTALRRKQDSRESPSHGAARSGCPHSNDPLPGPGRTSPQQGVCGVIRPVVSDIWARKPKT